MIAQFLDPTTVMTYASPISMLILPFLILLFVCTTPIRTALSFSQIKPPINTRQQKNALA
jgi:hypothetical protein